MDNRVCFLFVFSSSSHSLFSQDATVKVWDTRVLRSGRPLFEMSPYTNCGIRDAQWSPDSSSIATVSQGGGDDAKVSVWALGDLGAAGEKNGKKVFFFSQL